MINAAVELVTPEQAKQILADSRANFRKIDHHRVALYASDMASGNWDLNGESIKFSGSDLIDGQHRLQAIVKAGVTVPMLVVRGVESSARSIDRGRPRTVAQWLAHVGIKNAREIASISRMTILYNAGRWCECNIESERIPDREIHEFAIANNERLQVAARLAYRCKGILPNTVLGSVIYCGCVGIDAETHELPTWFVKSIATGKNLTGTEAAYHLRSRLLGQKQSSQLSRSMLRGLATIAWNKTVRGETCNASSLRLRLVGPGAQKIPGKIERIADYE